MSAHKTLTDLVVVSRPGTLFSPGDFSSFGTHAAVGSALSRLARSGRLVRARRGVYFRSAESRFGEGSVSPMSLALKSAPDRGPGPAGASAAAALGLSTQLPVLTEVAVVGRPPAGVPNVRFHERSNIRRVSAGLSPKDVAVLEIARDRFKYVETTFAETRKTIASLVRVGEIAPDRIRSAAIGESRAAARAVEELFA